MGKTMIKLDSAGVRELLRSSEMAEICEKEAARMTRATGMEYVPNVYVGTNRVNAAGYDGNGGHNK